MKTQLLCGIGIALIILPAFWMGVYYADVDPWPPLSDVRWILIAAGVLLMAAGRLLHSRESADRE